MKKKNIEAQVTGETEENNVFTKYRYFCDACTNIAFFASEIKEGTTGTCQKCGKPYVSRRENYIRI